MLLDARRIAEGSRLDADVCVVGAGAAGISIARELASSSLRVLVLESGGLQYDVDTQDLYDGESGDREYPVKDSRLRLFGGSTMHWRGWCRPLDEIDFEVREGIPHSGWPFGRTELDPFYDDATRVCQLTSTSFDLDHWSRVTGTTPMRPTRDVGSAVFQLSPPTRFGTKYRKELERSRRVRVLLHANVVRVQLASGGRAVRSVRVATLSGTRFTVAARRFVLAAGGVENARLLLASDDVHRNGIGNGNDLVGRFFADHPHAPVGAIRFPRARKGGVFYGIHPRKGDPDCDGVFVTTDRFVRAEGVARCCLAIAGPGESAPLGKEVRSAVRDLSGADLSVASGLELRLEQAPNRDSRVTLTRERDALGLPRVRLDWRITELERRSMARSLQRIAAAVGAAGIARIYDRNYVDPDVTWLQTRGGGHHMGTARMARDPRDGVVDPNCRVHGVSNLYVAGSAVFPTTGFANPTLTIVALALRLAAHLKRELA